MMKNTELAVGDMVTITPKGEVTFEVLAIDELSDNMIYVERIDNPHLLPPQWHFTTYARRVVGQEDADESY